MHLDPAVVFFDSTSLGGKRPVSRCQAFTAESSFSQMVLDSLAVVALIESCTMTLV